MESYIATLLQFGCRNFYHFLVACFHVALCLILLFVFRSFKFEDMQIVVFGDVSAMHLCISACVKVHRCASLLVEVEVDVFCKNVPSKIWYARQSNPRWLPFCFARPISHGNLCVLRQDLCHPDPRFLKILIILMVYLQKCLLSILNCAEALKHFPGHSVNSNCQGLPPDWRLGASFWPFFQGPAQIHSKKWKIVWQRQVKKPAKLWRNSFKFGSLKALIFGAYFFAFSAPTHFPHGPMLGIQLRRGDKTK